MWILSLNSISKMSVYNNHVLLERFHGAIHSSMVTSRSALLCLLPTQWSFIIKNNLQATLVGIMMARDNIAKCAKSNWNEHHVYDFYGIYLSPIGNYENI